ncbi:M1 family aminopeptidase [Sphingosinicella ginsenosidimutans]|uniref:Peptidase M1 membrane alanine aminopeptidase domain-containing protein n=1 Tax=Allosphingosinicella ginsenosidimutans TaxID=1176539 RepID=A0A5C6TTQ6_9SPHN|nr:M1 family aminopeptidase [Sphingosinicella ginsenosidimutans]TXC63656.1 hypothetical protein FRZ32_08285 [Sphingosinicella ginsenosidimutans]
MRRAVIAASAALLVVPAGVSADPAPAAAVAEEAPPPLSATATVARNGDSWSIDYRLLRRARAWLFPRSGLVRQSLEPWRPGSWRVETPGVRIERRGNFDVLVAAGGGAVPSQVRIVFTPAVVDLQSDYDPALRFTDGSVALYTDQFTIIPYTGAQAIDRLPRDGNVAGLDATLTRVTYRDADGVILSAGERRSSVLRDGGVDDGTYLLFGQLRPIVTDAMAQIVDPQLPDWIRATLNREVPNIFARYAAVLGPPPGPKPTVMVSWGGPTPRQTSMGGSVLPGLITLVYEGDGVLTENATSRGYGLWFIAHESAHFWLGNLVHYEFSRDAWITEGGADLLAFRTVAAVDPGYDWRGAIDHSIADCVALSANRGIASAEERNEQRAYYACGAVFALVAEAASRRPFIHFVKTLVDDNRADATVSRADWLSALDRVSNDPTLSRDIAALLDQGSADPKAAIASLFTRAGVSFTLGPDGVPRMTPAAAEPAQR